MCGAARDVCFGPTDIKLLDDLIGARKHFMPGRGLHNFHVNHQLALGRRRHRRVGWLLVVEDAVGILRLRRSSITPKCSNKRSTLNSAPAYPGSPEAF